MQFKSILFLDDMRVPLLVGVDHVWNYDEFVTYLQTHPMPEVISFDHDLALEHLPLFEDHPIGKIPYGTYKEKTGLDCARYIIENQLPLQYWAVHSFNAAGRINIEAELRRYRPQGEVRGLQIPWR
jgi:hypothetical protein